MLKMVRIIPHIHLIELNMYAQAFGKLENAK